MTELTLAHEVFQTVIDGGFVNMDGRFVNMERALEDAQEAGQITIAEEDHCLAVIRQYTNGYGLTGILKRNGMDSSKEAILAIFANWDGRPVVNTKF